MIDFWPIYCGQRQKNEFQYSHIWYVIVRDIYLKFMCPLRRSFTSWDQSDINFVIHRILDRWIHIVYTRWMNEHVCTIVAARQQRMVNCGRLTGMIYILRKNTKYFLVIFSFWIMKMDRVDIHVWTTFITTLCSKNSKPMWHWNLTSFYIFFLPGCPWNDFLARKWFYTNHLIKIQTFLFCEKKEKKYIYMSATQWSKW